MLGLIATRSVSKADSRHSGDQGAATGSASSAASQPLRALEALRKNRDDHGAPRRRFERHKADLGFGLLLKKYVDRRCAGHARDDRAGGGRHHPPRRADVLELPHHGWTGLRLAGAVRLAFWSTLKVDFASKPWLLSAGRCGCCLRRGSPANWAGSSPNTAASPGPSTACCPRTCRVSTLSVDSLYGSLAGFIGFYTLLLVVEMYLMFKFARIGPGSLGTGRYQVEPARRTPAPPEETRHARLSTLKIIWWLLVGVLLVGFAIMDGHDMGVGTLLPFVGRNDVERRVVINTVGPHWDGNQVWFITAGGAIFAAWPLVYATAFSGFYWAMLAVLWALFFRPVGFDYRSKIQNPTWRSTWDWGLFVGGAVPPLIFGVAFGNLLQGVPFQLRRLPDVDLHRQLLATAQSVRAAGRRGEPAP